MAGSMEPFPIPADGSTCDIATNSSFLRALIYGLKSLSGQSVLQKRRGSPTSFRAVKKPSRIVDSSLVLTELIPDIDFVEFFKTKAAAIHYSGEEVRVARPLTWEPVEPSLPSEVGQLLLQDFCQGGVLEYVQNFEKYFLPENEQVIGKTPRVFVESGSWEKLARGLLDKGLCEMLPESDIHHVNGRPLLNGLFAVSKNEVVSNIEVCRLIMNMKPTNRNCLPLAGDTSTLPSATSLASVFLDQDDVITTSSEDIKCFFYLFKVPRP